jgi:hypothetical protein
MERKKNDFSQRKKRGKGVQGKRSSRGSMRKSSPAVAGVEAAIAGSKPRREKAGEREGEISGRWDEGEKVRATKGRKKEKGKILIWLWLPG